MPYHIIHLHMALLCTLWLISSTSAIIPHAQRSAFSTGTAPSTEELFHSEKVCKSKQTVTSPVINLKNRQEHSYNMKPAVIKAFISSLYLHRE